MFTSCIIAFLLCSAVQGQILQQALSQLAGGYQNGMSASLFLPDKDCEGRDGSVGVCLLRTQCRSRQGQEVGSCPGLLKICCQETRTCNQEVKRNNTYFVHPANQQSNGMQCPLRVHKLPGVCQLRLDFTQFSLRGPDAVIAKCDRDRLVVTGQDFNNIIPAVCGENKGQHMYVDVGSVKGPVQLLVTTSEKGSEVAMNRQWSIRITQIPCTMRAPQGCLQYYTGSSGQNIRSFNYGNARLGEDSYPGGLDYTICIRKELGLCKANFGSLGRFGLNAEDTADPSNTCDTDYLLIGGNKFCGGTQLGVQPQAGVATEPTPTTRGNGPLWLDVLTSAEERVNTDPTKPGYAGFNLVYKQESCHVK